MALVRHRSYVKRESAAIDTIHLSSGPDICTTTLKLRDLFWVTLFQIVRLEMFAAGRAAPIAAAKSISETWSKKGAASVGLTAIAG
jgi:hypothetical protein